MLKTLMVRFFRWVSYFGVINNSKITTGLSEKIILSNRLGFVALTYYFFYCLFFVVSQHWSIASTHFFVFCCIFSSYFLNHKHRYYLSRTILLIAMNIGISAPDIAFGYKINAEIYFITSSLMTYLIFEFSDLRYISTLSVLPLFFWIIPRVFFSNVTPLYMSPSQITFFQYANSIGGFISPNLWAIIFIQTIIETNKKVMQLNKFSSLGEMSAGLSHEINNPLTVILASCNSMTNRVKDNGINIEEFSKYLERCTFNAKRIARIVNGLRFFSRTSITEVKTEVKIVEIVRNTLDLCYENFSSNQIKIEYPENSDVTLSCYAYEISQVLLNLLNNSRDAIIGQNNPWIKIGIDKNIEDKVIQISVTDSGKGIDPLIIDKIMTPFFTTKAIGKGTGLGLSISKGIVESHGGYLAINTNSRNTMFVMEFPIENT